MREMQRELPQEVPHLIASIPASAQHRRIALGVVIFLAGVFALVIPFAHMQTARIDAFIPVVQTIIFFADLITAVFLFAQYTIQPQRALLALASGYIFSGVFAFLQTLAFPGGYAPAGLIGDGLSSPAWIYVLWHTTFPAAIFVCARFKVATRAARPGRPIVTAIAITIACG